LALKHHKNDRERFNQQVENSREYVLPFIEKTKRVGPGVNVFEMGCGEGGVLMPFAEQGCYCIGVDLDKLRIDLANGFFEKEIEKGNVQFLYKNVFDEDFRQRFKNFFDIIILKDVIEHLHNQEQFIPYLKTFLKEGGQIFFGFPPWYMPFGGHQQIAGHKMAMMPWYHILPKPVYKGILKLIGESKGKIEELIEIYDTRITIERFERIVKKSELRILHKQHYLINPIYRYKFGLKPRKQIGLISAIPYVRDFLTTCVYYTVG
jgi:SAM-dependent methyltransferase